MGEAVHYRNSTHASAFATFEPERFASLCWAMQAAAQELSDLASKAAIHGGGRRDCARQETYVTMMLGPLSAIDDLRRQLTRT